MQTSRRSSSGGSSYHPSPLSPRKTQPAGRSGSLVGLPPPPAVTTNKSAQQTNYAQNLARSMTIDEMRELHRRALSEAEAKQTELRLVLASRYRELVGSSDEVTKMRERAQELHELVHALPGLMEKLVNSTAAPLPSTREDSKYAEPTDSSNVLVLRHKLSNLPRLIHRALDKNDVHEAAESLLQLFRIIAEQTDEYPLATALASGVTPASNLQSMDALLRAQMRMTFLHVQTLPAKITRISKHILNSAASFGPNPQYGAQLSASALSTLDLLDISPTRDRPVQLLDLYFEAKAQLLQGLLGQLSTTAKDSSAAGRSSDEGDDSDAGNAEEILSKIVLILQYDIILHPYQIFVLRKFPMHPQSISAPETIVRSLPIFPASVVQTKTTNFLSAHLPLIRTKVKSVLMDIAGTTTSALGKIRQSLYDKTDGVDCRERLDANGACTWEEAVSGVVDVASVLSSSHGAGSSLTSHRDTVASDRKLSLWSALFSNTFSSLVHSLLTTSFQSVHTKVVSALRLSLTNAPPLSSMLPHQAYRNTLHIASELDAALLKVSDDAHELLVHAEEREESETRLRQSLYVQTCEIMGRLICELRRMLLVSDSSDAVKELIVGRLCHLLKFRLTALPTLLDPNSSPAVLHGTSGMISMLELSSAFDLADDNDDGLITFQEAMEAVDSAFSGTQFHGAEMVRETLLLAASGEKAVPTTGGSRAPQDVTLNELTLLLARGLRHESSGRQSALGTIQESLNQIIASCFEKWAAEVLHPHANTLSSHVQDFVQTACTCSEAEYQRIYSHLVDQSSMAGNTPVNNVSPHVIDFLLQVTFTLNRSVCPSDSLEPVPSKEYASSMGVDSTDIPCLMTTIRWALLSQGLSAVVAVLAEHIGAALGDSTLRNCGPSGLVQLKSDLTFVGRTFFRRNRYGFGKGGAETTSEAALRKLSKEVDALLRRSCDKSVLTKIEENHSHIMEVCDLFFSSLLGQDDEMSVPLGDLGGSAATPGMGSNPLLYVPLASSCRFPLLPIQSDRTLSGVQARNKYKEKDDSEGRQDRVGGGAVRAGLGFFSSMLKKN